MELVNKTIELSGVKTTYFTLIKQAILNIAAEGITIEAMANLRPTIDKLNVDSVNTEFTKVEINLIKSSINKAKWRGYDKLLIKFGNYINSL